MRLYGAVSPLFWTGRTGRAIRRLGAEAQVVALYLQTAPGSNMLGLYYAPLETVAHETGVDEARVEALFGHFAELGFAHYDATNEVVWIVDMAVTQIGETVVPKDSRHVALQREAAKFTGSPLHALWRERYREPFHLDESAKADAPSHPPSPGPSPAPGYTEQGQGQDRKSPTPLPPPRASAPAREAPEQPAVAAVAVIAPLGSTDPTPNAQHPALVRLQKASKSRFDPRAGNDTTRAELLTRLMAYNPSDALLDRMGVLMQHPQTVWPWAKNLGRGFVTSAWLLGKGATPAERTGGPLGELVCAANLALHAERARQKAEADRAAEAERRATAAFAGPVRAVA